MGAGTDEDVKEHDEYIEYMAQHRGSTEQPGNSDLYCVCNGDGRDYGGGGGGQGNDEYIEQLLDDVFIDYAKPEP